MTGIAAVVVVESLSLISAGCDRWPLWACNHVVDLRHRAQVCDVSPLCRARDSKGPESAPDLRTRPDVVN